MVKFIKTNKGVLLHMSLIILASMLLWGAVIHELNKPSKKQSERKMIPLVSLSSLSTLIITISLFSNLIG
jgi:hypothetical protein